MPAQAGIHSCQVDSRLRGSDDVDRGSMEPVQPILVSHLFPPLLDGLLDVLGALTQDQWERPTACAGWTVKDVAAHLLGVDIGNLSRHRDQYRPPGPALATEAELLVFINRLNDEWMCATRRFSPRLLREALGFTGPLVSDYFAACDPYALGGPVTWAGPDPAPVWLDIAREYTERWHHQQHVRDAVGRPGFTERCFMTPALDAFVRALPHTYRTVEANEGTTVTLTISGEAGGVWTVRREAGAWRLYLSAPPAPTAHVTLDQDTAWRLFTRGIDQNAARVVATVEGNQALGAKVFDMVSIIA
jgi:uncharacterized protein (TIGR03083 family)